MRVSTSIRSSSWGRHARASAGTLLPLVGRPPLGRVAGEPAPRAVALSDEITGAVVVYNNLTDVFTVDGQKKALPASGSEGQASSGGRSAEFKS